MLSQNKIKILAEETAKTVAEDLGTLSQEKVKTLAKELAKTVAEVANDGDDEELLKEALRRLGKYKNTALGGGMEKVSDKEYLETMLKVLASTKREAERKYKEDMEDPIIKKLEGLRGEAEKAENTEALDIISNEVEKLGDTHYFDWRKHRTMMRYYKKAHKVIVYKFAALENRVVSNILDAAIAGRKNVYDNF